MTLKEKIELVAKVVRLQMEHQYGTGTNLCGHCIDASDEIVDMLYDMGINAKTVEGWCLYDDDSCCSDRCYDEHTWVEVEGIYVDVTADQFNGMMYTNNKLSGIIVGEKPECMLYDEPDSKQEDLIRKSFDKDECVTFPVQIEKEDPITHKVIKKDPERIIDEDGIVYYENEATLDPSQMKLQIEYMFGQVSYSSYYKINEVKHPVYAVIENFLAPFKGIPSVERMYHKPFDSVKDASDYIKHTKFHTKTHNVQVYIAVFDLDKVNTEWYKNQLQVIDVMSQFGKDMILDNSFRIYPESHIEALKRLQRR